MKAIVLHGARDLRIEERPDPRPGPGQVLVAIERGGICGSDLHYFHDGRIGAFRVREPMILGHEISGRVAALGDGVEGLAEGQAVAVSPSRPCWACRYCRAGMPNQCLNMRFYGSAMPFPHIQGAFADLLVAEPEQCVPTEGLTSADAALAEPLAVVLHAASLAGRLLGRRVLVTGCGPIGLLAILVAKAAGAAEIVATDITGFTLAKAEEMGASETINVGASPDGLRHFEADKGHFDVLFECTGVAAALASAVPALRPGAAIVQLGLGGDMTLPLQAMTAKELILRGSFRFHSEFRLAVEMMQSGRLEVGPLVTHVLPMSDAGDAFALAANRNEAIKVHLAFG